MLSFEVHHRDSDTSARAAALETPHGVVRTPAFMPVGTQGTVKGIAAWELQRLDPEIVLANTYHLLVRPGIGHIEALGGLHRVMAWGGPILTDSGGYQVYSLAGRRTVDDDGVSFQSHVDGSPRRLTPENTVEAQARFGVDIAMVLDECVASGSDRRVVELSVERSLRWAGRGLAQAERLRAGGWRGGLFGIQQGGLDRDLRARSSEELAKLPFDGLAVGGLAVGETTTDLHDGVGRFAPMLPEDRPRYLMGVGYPEDILHAVACGVDLFDCVLPTRSARTGKIFTASGEINIKNARWADDDGPLDPACGCPTCAVYSRGALRHLFVAGEATSVVLLTVHNLSYFLGLMRGAREAIMAGRYAGFRRRVELARGHGGEPGDPAHTER